MSRFLSEVLVCACVKHECPLSNGSLILADETDSQSWRSPLKAISEFFKGDPKGESNETGLNFH